MKRRKVSDAELTGEIGRQRTFFRNSPEEVFNELRAVALRFLLQQIAFQSVLELEILRPGNLPSSPTLLAIHIRA